MRTRLRKKMKKRIKKAMKARTQIMMMYSQDSQGSLNCRINQQTPCRWTLRLGVNPRESQKISGSSLI